MKIKNKEKKMDKKEYIILRLTNNKDDRCDDKKLDSDARLRGNVGKKNANEIIKVIDDLKMKQ
jgi:hypothetical protein